MNKSIKNICLLSACSLTVSASYAKQQTPDDKMNVVFLLVDDLRWNSLHCMGTDFLVTPNIDGLAEDGVRFTNSFVTTGISCVSRATIFSGQYMSRHNIAGFGKNFTPEKFADTYPGKFRQAGYWTGMVGKYGVGKARPTDFDYVQDYYGKYWYPKNGKDKIQKLADKRSRVMGDSIHVTDRNLRDALEFLDQRPDDQPFCLSVGFWGTHAEDHHPDQYRYKPESADLYKDITIPVSVKADDKYLAMKPAFIQNAKNEGRKRWLWRFDTPEKHQMMMKAYYRVLTEVDAAIGQIVDRLKEQGVYDNTIIVFMGDNGYFHSEHQLADKWFPYEEATRVPMIIHDPRIKKRKRNMVRDEVVLNIDIAPTILAAAGVEVPEAMQGEDLSQVYLDNNVKGWRKDFFYEHPMLSNRDRIPSSQALISLENKYIYWPEWNVEEYYDYAIDPLEVNNVVEKLSYKTIIEKAKVRFAKLRELAK